MFLRYFLHYVYITSFLHYSFVTAQTLAKRSEYEFYFKRAEYSNLTIFIS